MDGYHITIHRKPSRESQQINEYHLHYNFQYAAFLEVVAFDGFVALHGVTTFDQFRRKGLMRRLLNHVRLREFKQLRLVVEKDNAAAIALYQQAGFKFTQNQLLTQQLMMPNPIYDQPLNAEDNLTEMVWAKPRKLNRK